MVLVTREHLKEIIIDLLAYQPKLSAQEIQTQVSTRARPYSAQAVFKELRKLQDESIVVKRKQRYSLNLTWAVNFMQLSDTIEKNYLSQDFLIDLLPETEEKSSWTFHDLLRLRNFWAEILLLLARQAERKCILSWNPHPWTYLLQTSRESHFLKALELSSITLYKIIGGTTPLDRWSGATWEKHGVQYSFAPSPFEDLQAVYFNVVDDHILTIRLDNEAVARIEQLYQSTPSISAVELHTLFEIFRSRITATLTIELNPRRAVMLYKKFQTYFGFTDRQMQIAANE